MRKSIILTATLVSLFYPIQSWAGALNILWRYGSTNVQPGQILKTKEIVRTQSDGKVFALAELVNAKITVNPSSEFSVEVSRKRSDGSVEVVAVFQKGSGRISVPRLNNPRSSFFIISPRQGFRQVTWKQACLGCQAVIDPSSAVWTRIDGFNTPTHVFIEQAELRTVGVAKGAITEFSGGALVPMSESMYVRYTPGQIPRPTIASRDLAARVIKAFSDLSVLVGVDPGNKIILQGRDFGEEARLNYGVLFSVLNPLGDSQDYYVGISQRQNQTRRSFVDRLPDEVAREQLVY